MWAKSIADGDSGVIQAAECTTMVADQLDKMPDELVDNGDCSFKGDISKGGSIGVGFTNGTATTAPVWAENNDTQP